MISTKISTTKVSLETRIRSKTRSSPMLWIMLICLLPNLAQVSCETSVPLRQHQKGLDWEENSLYKIRIFFNSGHDVNSSIPT